MITNSLLRWNKHGVIYTLLHRLLSHNENVSESIDSRGELETVVPIVLNTVCINQYVKHWYMMINFGHF